MTSSPLHRRAFTLIELLIVITIIGILAVALIPRLTGGPGRARDAQRQSDLQQISTALEMINNDRGGYPFYSGCISAAGSVTMTDLSTYLTSVPADPNTGITGGLVAGELNTGSCSNGYTYIGLKSSGTPATTYSSAAFTATGYLIATDLETESTRTTGVYDVTAGAFAVTTTSTASTNFSSNSAKSCMSSSCASSASQNVIYVIGR